MRFEGKKCKIIAIIITIIMIVIISDNSLFNLAKRLQVKNIYIETNRDKLPVNTEINLSTIVEYKDGSTEIAKNVQYLSSDNNVISVKDGVIKSENEGEVILSTNYLGKEASRTLKVTSTEDLKKDLNRNYNVTFEWIKEDNKVRFWWSGAPELKRYTVLKKSGDEDFKEVVSKREGTEYIDEIKDSSINYTYKIFLTSEFGLSYQLKEVTVTSEDDSNLSGPSEYKPIDIENNDSQYEDYSIKKEGEVKKRKDFSNGMVVNLNEEFSIKNNQINIPLKLKYSYEEENNVNEDNIRIFMKDEEGKLIISNSKVNIDKENKTIEFQVESQGIYVIKDIKDDNKKIREIKAEKSEEETAKEYLAKRDTSFIYCIVDGVFEVKEDYIKNTNGQAKIEYTIEDKNTNEKDLEVFRVLEDKKLLLQEKTNVDINKKEIDLEIKSAGLYVIREKSKVKDQIFKINNNNNKEKKKVEISNYDIALSGIFGYDDTEITEEDVEKYKKNIPDGQGIFILEKDRDNLLKLINESTNCKYDVDEKGFLKKIDKENLNKDKSETYSKIIDDLINSNKKIIVSLDNSWLFYNKESEKLQKSNVIQNKGLNIRKNNEEQLIILGKESNNEEDNKAIVLFHELFHATRTISEESRDSEEKLAIDNENIVRKELKLKERNNNYEDSEDIVNLYNIIFTYDQDIEVGASGPEVVELQRNLIKLGFTLGGYGATGVYGPYTVAAINAIQESMGYDVVGRYGPKTRKLVNYMIVNMSYDGNYFQKAKFLVTYKKYILQSNSITSIEDLDEGNTGDRVIKLQEKLLTLGFDLGGYGATGYFGTCTKNALEAIQKYKGYDIVGRYGPKTRATIEELLKEVNKYGYYYGKSEIMNSYMEIITNKELDPGDSGEPVRQLQLKLISLGFDLGGYGATGYFGTYTVVALKAIQKHSGLDTVGRFGPGTREALKKLIASKSMRQCLELQRLNKEMFLEVELDPGEEGPCVIALQEALVKLGFDLGGWGATGYFGEYTSAALNAIQEHYGLGVVGRYGPKTRVKLKELLNKLDSHNNYSDKGKLLERYNKYKKIVDGYDETINVNGKYNGRISYYDQEDSRWRYIPYGSDGDNIGNAGCGVTAMAIVESTMKRNGVNPIELANYSLNNGFCYNGTSRNFFVNVSTEDKYSLNCMRLQPSEIQTVKSLLSDGRHMAIAIMGPGHFTKCGHYIVLSGIETIDGKNYFDVVDPHRVNSNYSNDKNMIDSNKNDGFVKAAANIFTRECQEYWVFSLDGAATHKNSITNEKDQLIENKINLERLGYGRLRNSKGEITSEWDKQFNDAVNQFIADFGLKEKYDELGGNKKTQIYVWISQAVNGQISKIQADTGSQGTNNKTHKEVITLESIRKNYYLGIGDALVGATKDIFEFVSHPIDGVVGAAKGILFLNKVRSNPSCEEALILDKIIVDAVENFIDSNLNEKARLLGRVVGEIVIIVATDGVAKSIMGYLPEIANKIKNGERVERIVDSIRGSKGVSEADKLKLSSWKYAPDEELYLKYKDVFDNPKYYNQTTGEINWPGQHGDKNIDGFLNGKFYEVTLKPGEKIDRYGTDYGSFASPEGISYGERALAPGTDLKPYSVFEVIKPMKVKAGEIAPWFNETGGGIQYVLPDIIDELLDAGIIRRVK
ncbi:peptidoglycan-binding protein [Clostridium septicum]|uniref:peptidoglycan-binding protein n=2 Tax=Clostridium septicum TaxID=1504 RepID=UPI00272E8EAD|nr:peptidoglycan-binding protein [Clostridium septicum]WLF69132.1 peptidoglycan-binding protein [Clostridium septicum]